MKIKNKFSIGIATYESRFESHLKPLVESIKSSFEEVELILCVNGEHNQNFNDQYRKSLLTFICEYKNIYPFIFTEFRSLSKLWNNLIINSSNDFTLILNDDVSISKDFFSNLDQKIDESNGKTFTINSSWSHFLSNRNEIYEVGWFDERLLGVGCEDGDFAWRYQDHYGLQVLNLGCDGINNLSEKSIPRLSKQRLMNGYSKVNDEIMQEKYFIEARSDSDFDNKNQWGENERRNLIPPVKFFKKGNEFGMMPHLRIVREETKNQYPYEKFFWDKKHLI